MKSFMKLTALLLCMAMLTSTLAGCGPFGGNDTAEDVFDPPYLENYYVNNPGESNTEISVPFALIIINCSSL